jgi:glycosyltransferase involved in cell wall biosynthesis
MITHPKKICIALPTLVCGGTERTAALLANDLANKGYKVSILLLFDKPIFYQLNEAISIITPKLNRAKTNKYIYLFYLPYFIVKSLNSIKPDRLFVLGYISLFLFSLRVVKKNYKVIISNRTNPLRSLFPFYQLVRNSLYKTADGIIAQTDFAADIYKQRIKHKNIIIIPNFLRQIVPYNVARENILVSVGRLVPEKGHEYLIKAFAASESKEWRLVIVGGGYLEAQLKTLIIELNLQHKIDIVGFSTDVDKWLSQAKIFVMASQSEGYPNALIEAMAHNLPCISFDCTAGPAEIIKNQVNGILIPLNDIKMMSDAISLLIADENLRNTMGANAGNIRITNDFAQLARRYEQFIFA